VFENSPIAWRIGRAPVITLIGIVSLVFVGVGTARILVDHAYTPNLAFADYGALTVIVAGVIIFYAMRYYRTRQGLNIDQRYREIQRTPSTRRRCRWLAFAHHELSERPTSHLKRAGAP